MTMRRIAGLILVLVGIVALLSGGLFWTDRDTVVDAGPIKVTKEDREGVSVPPLVGIVLVVGGIVLLALPSRGKP